jgi:hypothetical protein
LNFSIKRDCFLFILTRNYEQEMNGKGIGKKSAKKEKYFEKSIDNK